MAVIDQIIENAMFQAELKAGFAASYSDMGVNAATGHVTVTPNDVTAPEVSGPNVDIPTKVSGVDQNLFNSVYGKVISDLSDLFYDFIDRYLSIDPDMMAEAEAWIKRAITQGGTGVNATVEARIWQRDRDRISAEAASSMAEAVDLWASKGYPMPPGAANAAILAIQRKRAADVAAVSRDAAIKAFETEVENVKFAIQMAIEYRTKTLGAAGDYVRALAAAPDVASRLAVQSADAQARLISAASSFYNAQINAAEMVLRANLANQDADLKAKQINTDSLTAARDIKVKAIMAAAESLGQQAAAALNGINATAQLVEAAG